MTTAAFVTTALEIREREVTISNFIVVILPDETSAELAARSLEALHATGSIALFAMVRVVREADGTTAIHGPAPTGPSGAAVRILAAALAGFCSGPPSSGPPSSDPPSSGPTMSAGGLSTLAEFADLGVGIDVIEETCAAMRLGSAAVVAEIGEHWLAPVDGVAAALGAIIVRRRRTDAAAQQLLQEIRALEADLKELELETDRVGASATSALRSRANATRARLKGATRRAETMLTRLHEETDLKMETLLAQMELAGLELDQKIGSKAKIRRALAQTRAEVRHRSDVLARSVAIAKKAMGPGDE